MPSVRPGDSRLEEKVLSIIHQTEIPVSIDYIAANAGIGWGTARAILLKLSLEKKIQYLKTTKSWVFFVNEQVSQNGE